jgi:hypothetical protein
MSMRLGPGASDINAPNKPSYGDDTDEEEEETPYGTTYNGGDVGSLTLRSRGRDHCGSRIYRERDLVSDRD